MAFTRFPDPTNNIANLANQPVEPPATLKQKFDQFGEDSKDWTNNVFLPELESITNGDSGADNIGATALPGGVSSTVQGILEELDAKSVSGSGALTTHKSSADHDGRYFTEAETTALLLANQQGNHTGTWQGYSPVQSDPGIQSIVNEHSDLISNNLNEIRGSFLSRLQKNEVTKVRFIGDSITLGSSATGSGENPAGRPIGTTGFKEGYYTSPCYVNLFRNYMTEYYPTVDVFNAGIGGWSATTEGVTYRNTWIGTGNDVVFVMLGTNDRLDAATEEIFFESIESFCLAAKATCNTLVVMTAPPTLNDYYGNGTLNGSLNLTMERIDKVIANVCIKNNFEHISFYREFLNYCINSNTKLDALLQSTNNPAELPGSHPINDGHLLMWKILQSKLGIVVNTYDWENAKLPNQLGGIDSEATAASVIDLNIHNTSNLLLNGNFENTTYWTVSNGSLTTSANVGTITGAGLSQFVSMEHSQQTIPFGQNKMVYVRCEIKPNNDHVSVNPRVAISGVSGSTIDIGNYGKQTVGEYSSFSSVFETNASYELGLPYFYANVEYLNAGDSNGKTHNIKNVFILNLTDEFGVGNEPSLKTMDAFLESYGGYVENGTAKKNILQYIDQKDKIDAMWINVANTVLNTINDGNFDSLASWTPAGSTHTIASNVLTNTANGTDNSVRDYNYTTKVAGANSQMYYHADVYIDNIVHTAAGLRIIARNGGTVVKTINAFYETLADNTWLNKTGIITTTAEFASTNTVSLYLVHAYADMATANGKVLKAKNVVLINLTEIFGAGNEPTKEVMDLFIKDIKRGFVDSI